MKSLLKYTAVVFLMLGSLLAYASETDQAIVLYENSDLQKKLLTLPTNAELVFIDREGEATLVADRISHQMGWVANEQLKPSVSYYHHSISVQQTNNDEEDVIVYVNGKRLSDDEARDFIEEHNMQRAELAEYWQNVWEDMQLFHNDLFTWPSQRVVVPVILIEQEKQQEEDQQE